MRTEDSSPLQITDLSLLWSAVNEAKVSFDYIYPLWRGHADVSWPLRAEVFRPPLRGGSYNEVTLIRYFMAHAETRHQRCPKGDDLLGWLMLARHYGLPTRLLDWSWSPLIAIYFAVQEDTNTPKTDGCLWALEPGRMNLQMIGDRHRRFFAPDEPQVQQFIEIAFEANPAQYATKTAPLASKAIAVGTREIDMRVLVQQGAFTVHADGTDLAEPEFAYPDHSGTPPPWRRMFNIPKGSKERLRTQLRDIGFNKSTVFPDLAALAEEMKFRQMLS